MLDIANIPEMAQRLKGPHPGLLENIHFNVLYTKIAFFILLVDFASYLADALIV